MKRKFYILGLLAALCLLGTGYYAWTLYDVHCKQMAEWKKEAKVLFEDALLVELDKRGNIPVKVKLSGQREERTLNESYPDSVTVRVGEKVRNFIIPKYKTENSLMKDLTKRTIQGILLEKDPISTDVLVNVWDSLLAKKQIPFHTGVRYIYMDLEEHTDTLISSKEFPLYVMDSLTVKYMGFRCEYEYVGYVFPSLMGVLAIGDFLVLLFPWILLGFVFRYYNVIFKAFVSEKIVEKEIHLADVHLDKANIYKLPNGVLFDTFTCSLKKGDLIRNISPQSVNLLKLFLRNDSHRVTDEEIDKVLWNGKGNNDRLRNAIYRLRKDLKMVDSGLVIQNMNGIYELKSPISSNNFI